MFGEAWQLNAPTMKGSCEGNGAGPNNSDEEMQALKSAVQEESKSSQVSAETILDIVMQEFAGCIHTRTTAHSLTNPGIIQGLGQATCNPGTTQSPCPANTIRDIIHEGTAGSGTITLKNSSDTFASAAGDSKWYKAARRYNTGPTLMDTNNLSQGPTKCYASDIANRLVNPFVNSSCNESTIDTLLIITAYDNSIEEKPALKVEGNRVKDEKVDDNPPPFGLPEPWVIKSPSEPPAVVEGGDEPIIEGAASPYSNYYAVKDGDTCTSTGIDLEELRKLDSNLDAQ